jgi:hypothetical protein
VQQQGAATAATCTDPQRLLQASELRQRSAMTFLPLDGKEKVYGSIP